MILITRIETSLNFLYLDLSSFLFNDPAYKHNIIFDYHFRYSILNDGINDPKYLIIFKPFS